MVHSLIPQSVNIKTTLFETPARLINHMELLCAIGMAYKQAGMKLPDVQIGDNLKESRDVLIRPIENNSKINPKLLQVIQSYIFKSGETVDEDSIITMKLGYEFAH